MKKQFVTLCTFILLGSHISSQTTTGNLNQQKKIEIGAIRDLHVSLLKKNELNGSNLQKKLRIEYLPAKAKASDLYVDIADTMELVSLITSLKELNSNADSVKINDLNKPELSFQSVGGIEVQCYLVYEKTQALAGSGQAGTNEKQYVPATGKMYEGKTVYKDVKGTFIWKPVLLTPETNKTKDGFVIQGKRTYTIQLQKYVGASKVTLTSFEFKELISLLETSKNKMNS